MWKYIQQMIWPGPSLWTAPLRPGKPLSIMNFLDMTNFKTGGAAAIATKYLALPNAHVVGVIGSGTLSLSVLAAICQVREIQQVKVFDLNEDQAKSFVVIPMTSTTR